MIEDSLGKHHTAAGADQFAPLVVVDYVLTSTFGAHDHDRVLLYNGFFTLYI